jgi:AcrR family transcriptional regulator
MARYKTGIETRERIVNATRHLLAEVGIEGTTIQAICERADVRPGSFYNLFPSKDAAILGVVEQAAQQAEGTHSKTETIGDVIDEFIDFLMHHTAEAKIYVRIAVVGALSDPDMLERLGELESVRRARFARVIVQHQQSLPMTEVKEEAALLLSTLNGLALHYLLDPRFDVRRHANRLKGVVAAL